LEAFLNEKFGFKSTATPENRKRFISYSFTYACIWSMGASIDDKHHDDMSDFFRMRF
jgi:dynein heavy chain